ncbi:MAG: response regulator transcription factor [Verrucomicrobiaceae bacterium]|nr:response regulator transcription factor [Verrucomicrobiaceae bacterium]
MKSETAPRPTRVAIVDDHTLMREGLRLYFEKCTDLVCTWLAATASEAVKKTADDPPDVLILDLSLPDRSGLDLIKDLRLLRPRMAILILSLHDEKLYAPRALRAGARGYLMKTASQKTLENAVKRVAAGGIAVSEDMSEEILKAFSSGVQASESKGSLETLSDREFEVFSLIGQGKSSSQISDSFRISTKTVDVHKLNIRAKLGMRDPGELVFFAIRWSGERQN